MLTSRLVAPFTGGQLGQIHGQVVELLGTVGMKVTDGSLRRLLEKDGLPVDKGSNRVKFPLDLIEEEVRAIREENKKEESSRAVPKAERSGFQYGRSAAPFIYDWASRKIVKPRKADLIKMIRIGDVTKEAGSIGPAVIMSEVDARVERIEALALVIENTSKPVSIDYYYANQLKYVLELMDIVGQDGLSAGGGFIISPLTLGERTAACLLEESKYKIENVYIGTEPIAGASAPVTIVGTVTLGAAEILGGWIIARLINKKTRLKLRANITSGIMDMSTGKVCFCTPETIIQDAGVAQLCEEIYGVSDVVNVSSVWVDAKTPGMQAVWEKCFKQLALGCDSPSSFHYGLLDAGRAFCPTQMVIDYEINEMLESTFRNVQIDEEMMPVSEIKKIADANTSFLESGHTLKHFRQAIWNPKLLDRTMWRGDSLEANADKELLEKAEKTWRHALETYESPQRDEYIRNKAEDTIRRARKELLK